MILLYNEHFVFIIGTTAYKTFHPMLFQKALDVFNLYPETGMYCIWALCIYMYIYMYMYGEVYMYMVMYNMHVLLKSYTNGNGESFKKTYCLTKIIIIIDTFAS